MSSLKIKTEKNLTRQDWLHFLHERARDEKGNALCGCSVEQLRTWSEYFFTWATDMLATGHSLSFKPVGHLVNIERTARVVQTRHHGKVDVAARRTVVLRQLASKGPYLKARDIAQSLSDGNADLSVVRAVAFFKAWLAFLLHATDCESRIEIRGFGQFNVHKRTASIRTTAIRGVVHVKSKTYLKFSASKALRQRLLSTE